MQLTKRPTTRETATATVRTWRIRHTPAQVDEVTNRYGLRRYYLAVRTDDYTGNQRIVSRHRKFAAAVRSLARLYD